MDDVNPYEIATLAPLFGERMPLRIDDHARLVAALLGYIRSQAAEGAAELCGCGEAAIEDLAAYKMPDDGTGHRVIVVTGTLTCPHLVGQASIILQEGTASS